MTAPYRHIAVDRQGDVCCVRLLDHDLDEHRLRGMSDEVISLIEEDGCRKLALCLGQLKCIYSVFIAQLIKIRRRMADQDGRLVLCDVTRDVVNVLESCQLRDYFEFAKDSAAAVEVFGKQPK